MEFLQMLASQANDICTQEGRQKMNETHVLAALKELKFEHYIQDVKVVNEAHKVEAAGRKKMSSKKKLKESGLSETELLRQQEELFAQSRLKVYSYDQSQPAAPANVDSNTTQPLETETTNSQVEPNEMDEVDLPPPAGPGHVATLAGMEDEDDDYDDI